MNSLNMFNIEFEMQLFAVLAFLFTFILLLQILPILKLFKKVKLILNSLFDLEHKLTKSMNATSLIVLFYLIYFMIFKSILMTNIKTNSIIVDLSTIVDTPQELLNTKRHLLKSSI